MTVPLEASRTRPTRRQLLRWAGFIALLIAIATVIATHRAIYFLIAFEWSAAGIRTEGSVRPVGTASDAAQACTGSFESRIVERRCITAFRRRRADGWSEQLVAGYVLLSRESISAEALAALKTMSRSASADPVLLTDLQSIIEHFERSE
jgi:hypothetical protein